ncbi:hypothetical protein SAMN05444354_12047 [Stigmatella aurantiaca]|uniref:Uncharacterized protein n=1 Tax=Stigmatella aurantiaca TaxID=41 RepID=A0A1H8A0U8_STIAU|nr:hypothetical protein [Stigmatella aurantiaca]SEM64153.1 hypothetical protein SAMN05444354_12047 [Stigmatella aurantiaca]
MKSLALLSCLVSTLAAAQQPETPSSATSPPPAPAATPAPDDTLAPPPLPPAAAPSAPQAVGPAESSKERSLRYSRYSMGPGGPLLAFTGVISGIVSGAIIGDSQEDNSDDDRDTRSFTGAVLGGLTLGTAATLYQYFVPVERNESFLVAGGAVAGFAAGIAIANSEDLSSKNRGLLSLLTTQAGVIGVLAATAGGGDVSSGDAALVGMTSLYALTLTALAQNIYDREPPGDTNYLPTALAPALGMALGGLLTTPLELESTRVLHLTLVPLGVGSVMLWLGSSIAEGSTIPVTALAGIVATFGLTLLLTSDPGVPTEKDRIRRADFQAMPVPVIMAAGRDNNSLAAGPGLFVSF